ncbi:MAG: methylenetetrahydromethanopterin dehydrogenase, partial [Methylicorpusculum sp.]|nr:methylenetetrahydromethanopterin dehydrogenase [Methylicorpusculum sp.]
LKEKHNKELKDCRALIFGGTGPVGIATGVISSLAGAETTIVDHLSIETAEDVAHQYNRRFSSSIKGCCARTDIEKAKLIESCDIIFCTAKAGIQVLNASVLNAAINLKVVGDVNAVPPLGIEGIKRGDNGAPLESASNSKDAVAVGALAIGDVKYQLQHHLIKEMLTTDKPLYLDFRDAFTKAQEILNL